MLIYLVQSAQELEGEAGYCYGLLQAGHPRILVTFAEYQSKQSTIFRSQPSRSNGEKQRKHIAAGKTVCDLGVGCEEYGVCYAEAHGEPERCGRL